MVNEIKSVLVIKESHSNAVAPIPSACFLGPMNKCLGGR